MFHLWPDGFLSSHLSLIIVDMNHNIYTYYSICFNGDQACGCRIISTSSLPLQLFSHCIYFIFFTPSSWLPPSPPALSVRCVCRALTLHSAASGIVGKLHRLLKIEQTATLWAIFLLGWSRRSRRTRWGGGGPKARFMVKISCELRRQKTNIGLSSRVKCEHVVIVLDYIYSYKIYLGCSHSEACSCYPP